MTGPKHFDQRRMLPAEFQCGRIIEEPPRQLQIDSSIGEGSELFKDAIRFRAIQRSSDCSSNYLLEASSLHGTQRAVDKTRIRKKLTLLKRGKKNYGQQKKQGFTS
ncbi:hypothetical protein ACFE04_000441 [Oxalis oulophora]